VLDLLHHHAKPRVLLGLVLRYGSVPQVVVAAYATDIGTSPIRCGISVILR
jgi:hypothetical protein